MSLFGDHLKIPLDSKFMGGLGKVLLTRDGPAGMILWACSGHSKLICDWNEYLIRDELESCEHMITMCNWLSLSLTFAPSDDMASMVH